MILTRLTQSPLIATGYYLQRRILFAGECSSNSACDTLSESIALPTGIFIAGEKEEDIARNVCNMLQTEWEICYLNNRLRISIFDKSNFLKQK